jgi:hypothetical protein
MKQYNNYADLITFTRASSGTALRPISYGDELVVNGTFDSDSDWVKGSSWSIANGVATTDGTVGGATLRQELTETDIGTVYFIEYTVSNWNSTGTHNAILGSAASSDNTGNGTFYSVLTQTGDKEINIQTKGNAAFSVDNVSVREVLFDQPDGTLTLFNHPTNIPRIEYDSDGNRLGLLVEESRSNLITYSNPTNGQWTVAQGTVDENDAASPDGFTSASTYKTNTSNAEHYTEDLVSVTSGTQYTFSVYLKKKGYDTACIRIPAIGFVDNAYFIFNFDTKQITTSVGTMDSYGVEDVGNGWLRAYMVRTANASAGALFRVHAKQPTAFTGDGDSGVYIYNAQLEAGSFMTSVIPTSGSTATRSADVASIGVSEFGYNSSEGTVFVDWAPAHRPWTGFNRVFEIGKSGGPNQISLLGTSGTNNTYPSIVDNSVSQLDYNNTFFSVTTSNFYKVCMSFKQNDFNLAYNSNLVVGDTLLTVPQIDQTNSIFIGSDRNGSSRFTGYIKSIKYYPRALTASQLEALTS